MTEKEEKKTAETISPSAPAAEPSPVNTATQAPATAPAQPQKAPHAKISKGEIWYNRIVYQGINYWVNLISSLAIADYFTHNGGRKNLDSVINNTAKGISKLGVNIKTAHHHSKVGLETLALMSGGWLLLIPMKWMEDNKRPLVHWLNKKLGVNMTAPDGHEETADEIYIEKEQPPQTWLNVFKRRIYSTLAVVGVGMTLDYAAADPKQKLPGATYDLGGGVKVTYDEHHLGGKERLTNWITGHINKGLSKLPNGETLTKKGGFTQRWLHMASLDTFFTAITATVMKVTNGAKKEKMPHEIGEDDDAPNNQPKPPVNQLDTPEKPQKSFAKTVGKRPEKIDTLSKKTDNDFFVNSLAGEDTSLSTIGI